MHRPEAQTPSSRRQLARNADSAAATSASWSAVGADLLDQLADLGGVLDVALLVDRGSRRCRRRRRSRSGRAGPRAWCARSAAGRSRSRTGGRASARPRRSAVQARTHSSVSAVGASPASPPAASTKPSQRRTWPSSSAAWRRSSGRSGSASAAVGADRRDRLDGVAVLARVAGELLGGQLPVRPALVEGMAKDVPPLATALDPLPDPFVHACSPFASARSTRELSITTVGLRALYDPRPLRPERDNIAAPVLPPRLRWLNAERPPVLAELTAAGPGARPLLRLRPAQQRPRAALRRSPGTSATATRGWRRSASTRPASSSPASAAALGAGARAARGRATRSPTTPLRGLARLRLRGLAVAVPLGPGRRAALVSLRRGRVRGDRGGDRRGAGRARPGLRRPRRRSSRCARPTRPGRWSPRRAEEVLPGGSLDRAVARAGPAGRSSSTTRPAAPTPRSTARASCG